MSNGNVMVRWRNGFGNCLFQYTFARLFAEKYGMNLSYLPENGRSCFKNPVEYDFISDLSVSTIDESRAIDIFKISRTYGNFQKFFELDVDKISKMNFIVGYPSYIQGLIEDYRIYADHIDTINSWFEKPEQVNEKDLVFHIRLGDNWNTRNATNGGVIPQEYYLKAAELCDYEKLYIVTDDVDDKYLDSFSHLNPIFLTADEEHEDEFTKTFRFLNKKNVNYCIRDFNFLRSFKNIVVGNSTFSWWAAFLGQNKNVYVYKHWQRGHVNLGQTELPHWNILDVESDKKFLDL